MDHDLAARRKLQGLLTRRNFDVALTGSLPETLKALQVRIPRLGVIQNRLPDINGEDLADRLKGIQAMQDVPLIIYSRIFESQESDAEDAGDPNSLKITAEGEELLNTVQTILDKPTT